MQYERAEAVAAAASCWIHSIFQGIWQRIPMEKTQTRWQRQFMYACMAETQSDWATNFAVHIVVSRTMWTGIDGLIFVKFNQHFNWNGSVPIRSGIQSLLSWRKTLCKYDLRWVWLHFPNAQIRWQRAENDAHIVMTATETMATSELTNRKM